jgi:hypothetical protein
MLGMLGKCSYENYRFLLNIALASDASHPSASVNEEQCLEWGFQRSHKCIKLQVQKLLG